MHVVSEPRRSLFYHFHYKCLRNCLFKSKKINLNQLKRKEKKSKKRKVSVSYPDCGISSSLIVVTLTSRDVFLMF